MNTLRININRFEITQTVQTLFTFIDQIVAQPGTFHLTHFTAQYAVLTGVITFKTDMTYIETVPRINVDMQFDGLVCIINFWLCSHTRIGIAITTQHLLDVVFHFGDFGAVIQLAFINFSQALNFC
ncbi:hypothetical protein SRABI106_00387 [Rahnella aquatilis]|nr:hypothetical protein SRABI106_00387 [Rahnella aquatilis]